MNIRQWVIWFAIVHAANGDARAEDSPGWHLIVGNEGNRTAVRMSDGTVSKVKLGGGEFAVAPNMAGATRTVRHMLSPDGKYIVYEMERDGKVDAHFIACADADGKNFRTLSQEGSSVAPAWSVDGKHVAFLAQRPANQGAWHVFRIDAGGDNEKQISKEPVSRECHPSFAADGRLIYAVDRGRDGKMHLVDLVINDGQKETVLMPKAAVFDAVASPDGNRLATVVPGELQIRDLKSGKVQTIAMKDVNPGWRVTFSQFQWRPDSNAIAVSFGFLGGMKEGARIAGDDHVAVVALEADNPTVKTYQVGTGQALYAWVTDADMNRKK